ncbi:MAG: phosphatidylglycerophosphatase A [Verrucomicrobiales bacterium]|nr:phosphatidylglycerophosphatase A [Verrucomicrobiales bacterium]
MLEALLAFPGLGGSELMLVVAVLLVLFCAKRIPPLAREIGEIGDLVFEAFTTRRKTYEVWSRELQEEMEQKPKWSFALFLAQGFGCGKIPFAPGTFGSVLGLGWFALLLWPGSVLILAMGTLGGIALSVRLCGLAEKQLHQRDPSSVVLDEIVAMPICFLGWLVGFWGKHQVLPGPEYFFRNETWLLTASTFVLFRIFDILKPWPLRQSQALPGGWGVTVDDLLAAVCTAIISGILAAEFLT